ncbi:MAG: hypothetical protein K8T91_26245 [Planctomycetes bacterium]|nr:hypothetical protein [Planctomycetota bacterium]
MRKLCVLIAAVSVLVTGRAMAQTPTPARLTSSGGESEMAADDVESDSESGCGCDSGGCGKNGCGKHGCAARNANRWFNCNCNGSYKFPVPPLYTYHWPGMYSMKRMTDYHSPWRFPAIKPYEDETPVRDLSQRPQFRQASSEMEAEMEPESEIISQQVEQSVSDRIARRYATEQ